MFLSPAVVPLTCCLLLTSVALAVPAGASTSSNEIVFVVDGTTTSQVVVRDLASRSQQVVLSAATTSGTFFDTPELSPDGTKVVVVKDATDAASGTDTEQLLVIDRATKAATELARATTSTTATVFEYDVYPTVSPDGATVLWTHAQVTTPTTGSPTIQTELRTAPITGGAVPTTVTGSAGTAAGAWSPDGSSIVVTTPTAALDSSEGPLSLLNPATGALTALGTVGDQPVFSPDGTTLALAQTVGSGAAAHTVLATVPISGGAATILPSTSPSTRTNASTPGWSPDGQSLVYDVQNNADNTVAVWATDRAGVRAAKVVTSTSADYSTPAFNGPRPAPVSTDGVASTFTPVTPTRLLDTRTGNGGHLGKVGRGGAVTLTVVGRGAGGVTIPADATAVVLNVTVADGTLPTVVRVFPAPASNVPATSSLNTTKVGQVIANQVTVKLPPSTSADAGKIVLYNGAGTVDLVADIAGFYSATGPGKFQPVDPSRILDSRNGTGTAAAAFTTTPRDVSVTGTRPVSGGGTVTIPTSATAVVLNVTATATSTNTFVRVYPTPTTGGPLPTVSSLNVAKGATGANLVTVAVPASGTVRFQNAAGTAQLIADIAGYYDPGAPGVYVPVTPIRFLDTRSGTGAAPIPTTAAAFVDLLIAGTRGIPSTAVAAVLNLTGTATSTPTIVRAYPSTAAAVPTVSNLNLVKADSRANAAVVKPGSTGRVRILNGAGSLQLIADVAGYFVPAA